MSYHKENLKEHLIEIAWEICKAESWQKVNMRKIAQKADVSTTAFYRHFKTKNDLKAELILRGFEVLDEGRKSADIFASWGAHYIKFGLDNPHIYDLMFGNTDSDMPVYPDIEAHHHAALNELYESLENFMPDATEKDIRIKAVNIWASVHGLVGFLRRASSQNSKSEELKWIENNLEEYLKMTTFR